MKRNVLILAVSVCLLMMIPINVFAYSPSAAINYADKYALTPNYMDSSGKGYNYYATGDCTNFVSQCLYTGGFSQDATWKTSMKFSGGVNPYPIRTDSVAWKNAETFKNYLKNNRGATKLGSWSLKGTPAPYITYAYVNNSNNLTNSNKGKTVVFYDWDGDAKMDHSALFIQNNGSSTYSGEGTGDLIDQHTTNRKHVLWRPDSRQSNTQTRNMTRVYAFQI